MTSSKQLVVTFAGLVVLAVASWIASAAGAPPLVAIAIAGVKAVWIAAVFMELAGAPPLVRAIAAIAILFVVLLYAGTLADVALRR